MGTLEEKEVIHLKFDAFDASLVDNLSVGKIHHNTLI